VDGCSAQRNGYKSSNSGPSIFGVIRELHKQGIFWPPEGGTVVLKCVSFLPGGLELALPGRWAGCKAAPSLKAV